MDSARRQRALQFVAEVSTAILVGTIIDTTISEGPDGDIYTRYGVAVDTLVAGPTDTPPEIHFRRLGGSTGKRSTWVSASTPIAIGRTYLLSLYRCGQEPDYSLWDSSCVAEVVGGVAHPTMARHTSPIAALLDTLATYARVRNPEFQKSQSDAGVTAHVITVQPTASPVLPGRSPAIVQVGIDSVLWCRQDPQVAIPKGYTPLVLAAIDDSARTCGEENAHLVPGGQYVLFLRWVNGMWEIAPSSYSAWRRDGDNAVVQAHLGPCGDFSVIASTPWNALMSRLH